MQLHQAREMLVSGFDESDRPATWADLGCGQGTFTVALAGLLPPHSIVHALDREAAALRALPSSVGEVRIRAWHADFVHEPWPFASLDGILMANALHFVREPHALIARAAAHLVPVHRLLIVEYDTDAASPWVPYPLSRGTLAAVAATAGYTSFRVIASRPSRYQRAGMYAALIQP